MTPPVVRAPRRGLLRTSVALAGALLVSLLAPVVGSGAALVTASATATTVVATATATDVGAPSWWVGDCDATRWGPIAKSKGWTGVGSHRLGASYLGVPVCGPRPSVDGSPDVMWGRAGWGESEWQCVELAQRFMAQVYGTQAFGANGSQVVNNYRTTYGGNLVKVANGTVGKAPVPGDIVSFTTPNNPYGHVVVITSSTVDGNGNGTVTMLSQNDTATGWRTLPVVAWRLQGFGSLTPYGWLHDPAGRGNPLGDGTFVRVVGTAPVYRIVGGAPIRVSSWAAYGGVQPVAVVEAAQFARLRPVPSDGTYLSDSATGQVYRIAGGAPLLISAAEAPTMPGWGSAPVWAVDDWSIVNNDHLRPVPADRTQMCRVDTKDCYVVAGGAPMLVPAANVAQVPGWASHPTTIVSSAEFTSYVHLHPVPADGTFLCDASTKTCYNTVGGAPMVLPATDASRLPGWSATAAVTIPHAEFATVLHLRPFPPDGTVLCPVGDPLCYVVAGRAPLAISPAAAIRVPALRTAGAPRISSYELTHPVHLRLRPLDGTLLQPAGSPSAYVVTAGVARPTALKVAAGTQADSTLPITVDQAAIDNAGVAGPWTHLASTPAAVSLTAPTGVVTMPGQLWISWGRPVASSAVTSYQVRIRTATPTRAFTSWTVPTAWTAVTGTRVLAAISPGATECFSVRAKNRAGQVGPWSPVRCTSRPLDDRQASSLSRGWRVATSRSLYLGREVGMWLRGATWRLDGVTVARVGVVATTCPTCGSVRISLGARVLGTISLTTRTVVFQNVLTLPAFPTASGPLTLTVISPNGRYVWIDGVLASRA